MQPVRVVCSCWSRTRPGSIVSDGLTLAAVVGPFDPGHDRNAQLLAGGPGVAVEDVLL